MVDVIQQHKFKIGIIGWMPSGCCKKNCSLIFEDKTYFIKEKYGIFTRLGIPEIISASNMMVSGVTMHTGPLRDHVKG